MESTGAYDELANQRNERRRTNTLRRPAGRRRESSIVGIFNDALRHKDGALTVAYHVEMPATMFADDVLVDGHYDDLARMLAFDKPGGTLVQFRYTTIPDPGGAIINMISSRAEERLRQYSEEINKLAEQLSTMKGVLGQAEKLVLHNDNLTRTMAQIGQTVRDVFELKRAIETMIISRLNMIKSIKTRLMSGIFDPDADLRDFEDYLRNSIGRQEQDKIATMNRIAMFDATLARLYHDLQTAQARQAVAAEQMKKAKDKLEAELAKPQAEQCAHCISDLKIEIASCDKMIADLDTQITNLSTQIEDRVKRYNLTMEERVRIANRVKATDEAWDNLNIVKDSIFAAIQQGGVPAASPTPHQ